MPRFALLEHTGAPDDPAGLHYDLLLEEGDHCRTWRLAEVPTQDGPDVVAVELPPHRLAWLDRQAGEVSGGRGFARRIDAGTFEPAGVPGVDSSTADAVLVILHGEQLSGGLMLSTHADHWRVRLVGPFQVAHA